jgi:hypothetical protein
MSTEGNWQYEKVKTQEEVTNFKWYGKSSRPEFTAYVELRKIVGTTYLEYCAGDWVNMMRKLNPRREGETFPAERYFEMVRSDDDHSQVRKLFDQPITVDKYGDEYIISMGGNHRICHAKFDGIKFLRLRVNEHFIDPALREAALATQHTVKIAPKPKLLWERAFDWLFAKLGL